MEHIWGHTYTHSSAQTSRRKLPAKQKARERERKGSSGSGIGGKQCCCCCTRCAQKPGPGASELLRDGGAVIYHLPWPAAPPPWRSPERGIGGKQCCCYCTRCAQKPGAGASFEGWGCCHLPPPLACGSFARAWSGAGDRRQAVWLLLYMVCTKAWSRSEL